MSEHRIIQGDVLDGLRTLPDCSVQCVVTSPPYLWLRNYGIEGQIGLEKTVDEYIQKIVEVFRDVRRVLRYDGTLFLNIGDSYAGSGRGPTGKNGIQNAEERQGFINNGGDPRGKRNNHTDAPEGFKAKDMLGIPWRVAFALQADGWYLRSDIVWSKPNPMPESVTDRPTKAHEYIFLLTKSARYYYDTDGAREPVSGNAHSHGNYKGGLPKTTEAGNGIRQNTSWTLATWASPEKPKKARKQDQTGNPTYTGFNNRCQENGSFTDGVTRNARTVWVISTQSRPEAHFATFPDEIPRRCISAGTSEYGCCPKCGAPYERIVETSGGSIGNGSWTPHEQDDVVGAICGAPTKGYRREFKGWRPGCKCEAGDPAPCVVLDPFWGTGTVTKKARDMGRSSIGCEINPEYIKIGKTILQVDSQLDSGAVRYVFEIAGSGARPVELHAACLDCEAMDDCRTHDPMAGCLDTVKAIQKAQKERDHCTGGGPQPAQSCCGTCGHHKGRKTFHDTCPRLCELMFKGGTKSAKVLMDETAGNHPCLFWISKEADQFGPCPEKNSMGTCMHGAYSCPHKTEEGRAAVGCTYPIQPPHYAGDSPVLKKPAKKAPAAKKGTREWLEALTASKRKNNPDWIYEIWAHNPRDPTDWLFNGSGNYEGALFKIRAYENAPGKSDGTTLRVEVRPGSNGTIPTSEPALKNCDTCKGGIFDGTVMASMDCPDYPGVSSGEIDGEKLRELTRRLGCTFWSAPGSEPKIPNVWGYCVGERSCKSISSVDGVCTKTGQKITDMTYCPTQHLIREPKKKSASKKSKTQEEPES